MKSLSIIWLFFLLCPMVQAQTKEKGNGLIAPDHPKYYCITIRDLQMALTKNGYPIKVDNVFGKKTKKAFIQFVMDKGLPSGYRWGYLSDAIPALGIEPCLR